MTAHQTPQNLAIDADRFWDTVMASAAYGPGVAGGLSRLALSAADGEVRDYFAKLCSDAGLTLTVDHLGNMFARYDGQEDLPPVLTGSHLDTQIAGGKYTGPAGANVAVGKGSDRFQRAEDADDPVV
ncbi:MAG: hypothetical protein AAF580_18650, partial [Pseudomonadota bacterium]